MQMLKEHVCRDNGTYAGGGIQPRHATLRMQLKTGTFEVTLHGRSDADGPVHMADTLVTTMAGMPVQPWDLHVGALLRVLGSTLMLCQCGAATGVCCRRGKQRCRCTQQPRLWYCTLPTEQNLLM